MRATPYVLRGAAKATPYVLLAAAIAAQAQTPQQPPVFRSSADLVTIDVVVTTNGTPVAGLRAGDFVLTDNGVPQSIEALPLETKPATVTMILDIGEFMSETIKSFVDDVRKIATMVRPDDNVRLMAVDTYVHDLVPLRKSSEWPAIDHFDTNGLASANDALAAAIMRQHDPDRQHLIIAMTNGVDTGSVLDINALTEIARRSSAPLYIVPMDVLLEDPGPPKVFSTRWERGGGEGRTKDRLWMPFHDRDFELQEQAAKLTGGDWMLPGVFSNTGASSIFEKFYKTHRRSYRLRYTPKGVAREGWHNVKVTIPKYSSYEVSAKPGYSFEPPPATAVSVVDSRPAAATLSGLVAAYDRADYAVFVDGLQHVDDFAELIDAFDDAGNPWPDRPRREAAFVLELAHAALQSGRREPVPALKKLLDKHRLLVRDPLGPDAFEKYWLWTAVAILESVNEAAVAEAFVNQALARFPDEPRLILAKAFLLDRRQPFASGTPTATTMIVPQYAGTVMIPGRVSVTSGLPANHVRDVSAAYDLAMKPEDTRAEARIRKSLLLYRAGQSREALELLESADVQAPDVALKYFRELFRGRALSAVGSIDEATAAYQAALVLAPQAQSPHVALMALALLRGDRNGAAATADQIQKATGGWDPWWNYWQGDYRLVANAISRLRTQTQ